MTLRDEPNCFDAVEAYLDGRLEGEGLAGFEQRLTEEPDLARQVELGRAVNTRLRSLFQPPVRIFITWKAGFVQNWSQSIPAAIERSFPDPGFAHGPRGNLQRKLQR